MLQLPNNGRVLMTIDASRRSWLQMAGAAGVVALAPKSTAAQSLDPAQFFNSALGARASQVYAFRENAARAHLSQSATMGPQLSNGDEVTLPDFAGSFSKTLPHNGIGEVDPAAYRALLRAIGSGSMADYNAIPLASGATMRLVSPMGALAMDLHGLDAHATRIRPPPALRSAEAAGELVEVYWQALTRDVPFADYGSDSLIGMAVNDLNALRHPPGPRVDGRVTSGSIFRGETPADLRGPYISQFLWQLVPFGPMVMPQRYRAFAAGTDFLVSDADVLANQNGRVPRSATLESNARYIYNGRSLSEYVHTDFSYQAFLNAALICLGYGSGALSASNPYRGNPSQAGFVSFGGPDVLNIVAMAARMGLNGAWYQKWQVHRKLRPEAMAARAEVQRRGLRNYGLHSDALASDGAQRLVRRNGSQTLPMAFPEGAPPHPAYPAGHAAIAGACVTVLKAFFNPDFVIPNSVVAKRDGSDLEPLGLELRLGDELDKLAANISIGRDTAGVHYRSDGIEGMRLGEQMALGLLRDYSLSYAEFFSGFEVRLFDGARVRVVGGAVQPA